MPAKSKSQQRFFGMVHACQKTGKCASPEVKKVAKEIDYDDADDFASTKHDGLPEKKDANESTYGFGAWLSRRLLREGVRPIITPRNEVGRDGVVQKGYWLQSPENPPVPIDAAQARRILTNRDMRQTDRSHVAGG